MSDESQHKATELLRSWSTWLIGIDLAAATGCVVVLQGGVAGAPRFFLILAICAFAFSVLTAGLLMGMLPAVVQRFPLRDGNGRLISIYECKTWANMTLKVLAQLQYGLFALAVLAFVAWIVLKPV